MSVMSTGRASLKAAVGAEFMVPGARTAGSAPGGPAADSHSHSHSHSHGGQETAAGSRGRGQRERPGLRGLPGQRGQRVTELRVRELHVREVHVRQVRAGGGGPRTRPYGPVSAGAQQARPRQTGARPVRAGETDEGQVRLGETSERQVRLRETSEGQVRLGETGAGRSHPGARPGPVRLTRRGRAVVASLTVLAATAVAMLLWLTVTAAAQASSQSQPQPPGAGYRGMTQVVVRPGQTLWSIASAAEPAADARIVIQQIVDANALGGTLLHAGQLLWVPKG